MEGAFFSESIGGWIVPCNGTADLRFKYGDQKVPIHPLDLNSFIPANDTDPTVCYGSFVANNFGADFTGFDMLLGDGFLRNVYSL
ncbi:hypothetical protein EWM64_g5280 [Hericium alpestre]|uniref:Peptidase A1 domain-containing protein n=1 Tax=Hericium alpestre TaxID=135208 RepID=A0A4Y9ZVA4_9AGAM|nr:hypothetical protein EWM64_g5280 [Hericium alpestre]